MQQQMQDPTLYLTVRGHTCHCTVYRFSMLIVSTKWNSKSPAPTIAVGPSPVRKWVRFTVFFFSASLPTCSSRVSYRGSASDSNSDRVAPHLCSVPKTQLLLVQITFKNTPQTSFSGTEELSCNYNPDTHVISRVSSTSAANTGH